MELIDFAEQQGKANHEWQTRTNDITRQEANTTLGFMLAGGSASIAWSVSHLVGESPVYPLAIATIVLGLWLFLLATGIVFKCLNFAVLTPPTNHPLNVWKPKFDTDSIRTQQLEFLEKSILSAIECGVPRAKWLVKIRYLTCLSPVVFLVSWWVAAGHPWP